MAAKDKKIVIRAQRGDLQRLDEYVQILKKRHPGLEVTRSSAARNLILEGLKKELGDG